MKRLFALLLAAASLVACKKGQGTAAEAKEMLSAFAKPGADTAALFAELRPKQEDYEAVFVGDGVDRARAAMEPLWESGKGFTPGPEQTEVNVAGATPDQLAKHEGTAVECPAGYKNIADKLNPKVIIYCFRFVKPGDRGGIAGDALVHVNGHWAYFPKPFRYLNPAAAAAPAASGTPAAPADSAAPAPSDTAAPADTAAP